jgi:nucleoside-diphosphate-sugar epimerase/carbamoylphosphate synthase large subunit
MKIGICCIGSGVGQSVVNSCRLSKLPIETVGLGTNPLAYGLYECKDYAMTKSFYDPDYVPHLLDICLEKGISLLIPGHDDEAHIFSKNLTSFEKAGVKVIVAGPDLLTLCRDKEQMSGSLNLVKNVFVKSYSQKFFIEAFEKGELQLPAIAKPRAGFASRGIEILKSEADFGRVTEAHIVQELAVPHNDDPEHVSYMQQIQKRINPQVAEISIQLVARRDGSLMGRMASYNKLQNGVPIEILPYENPVVWEAIDTLMPHLVQLGLRGPLNLQGRMTNTGLKLFELNARFTGITGLRAMMGFNEVEACIREWAGIDEGLPIQINQNRAGIRQTADKVVELTRMDSVRNNVERINRGKIKVKKTVLVTGSTGSIGRRVVQLLTDNPLFEVFTLDRDKAKAAEIINNSNVRHFDWQDLESGVFNLGNVDRLVHLASARPHHGPQLIAQSLNTTLQLFARASQNGLHEIIHISSQSVYGMTNSPPWRETDSPAPESSYAQAKYAIEVSLSVLAQIQPTLRYTSLRLATVTGPDPEIALHEAIAKITQRLKSGLPVDIRGGDQRLERIDVRDAADAILRVIESESFLWRPCYNVGTGLTIPLIKIVSQIVSELEPKQPEVASLVTQTKVDGDVLPSSGLDISSFCNDFYWQPFHSRHKLSV